MSTEKKDNDYTGRNRNSSSSMRRVSASTLPDIHIGSKSSSPKLRVGASNLPDINEALSTPESLDKLKEMPRYRMSIYATMNKTVTHSFSNSRPSLPTGFRNHSEDFGNLEDLVISSSNLLPWEEESCESQSTVHKPNVVFLSNISAMRERGKKSPMSRSAASHASSVVSSSKSSAKDNYSLRDSIETKDLDIFKNRICTTNLKERNWTRLNPLSMPRRKAIPVCLLCNKKAYFVCTNCSATFYCSMDHLRLDEYHNKVCHLVEFIASERPRISFQEERIRFEAKLFQKRIDAMEKLANLGLYAMATKKWATSRMCFTQAIAYAKDIFGSTAMQVGEIFLYKCQCSLTEGNTKVAMADLMCAETCFIEHTTELESQPEVMAELNKSRGLVEKAKGNHDDAMFFFSESIYQYVITYGVDTVKTAGIYFAMGEIFVHAHKDYACAESLFTHSLKNFVDWLVILFIESYEKNKKRMSFLGREHVVEVLKLPIHMEMEASVLLTKLLNLFKTKKGHLLGATIAAMTLLSFFNGLLTAANKLCRKCLLYLDRLRDPELYRVIKAIDYLLDMQAEMALRGAMCVNDQVKLEELMETQKEISQAKDKMKTSARGVARRQAVVQFSQEERSQAKDQNMKTSARGVAKRQAVVKFSQTEMLGPVVAAQEFERGQSVVHEIENARSHLSTRWRSSVVPNVLGKLRENGVDVTTRRKSRQNDQAERAGSMGTQGQS